MTAITNALSTAATGSSQGYAVQSCSPQQASKRNTNKQHKQQNNDDNVGSAVAFTSFDFGPYLSKRTGSDIPDVSGRALFVLCDGFGGLSVDDGAKQDLPLQLGQLM